MRENWSFAPSGLDRFSTFTHSLRRGLHSCAASRLGIAGRVPLQIRESSSHAHTERPWKDVTDCAVYLN